MKRFLKFGIPLLIILLALVAMRFLLGLRQETTRRTPPPRSLVVAVEVVEPGPLLSEILAYGRVHSAQPVELFSEATGTLEAGKIPFRPGQRFAAGDLLLRIDERPLRLQMASSKSELLSALANLLPDIKVDFPDEYPVWQDYFDRFDIEGDLEDLPRPANEKIKLFLARYGIYQRYYGIRDQEIRLAKHRLIAPFAGVIQEAALREGSTARLGSRLGSLLNLDDLEVEVSVPAQDLDWIRRQAAISFHSSELAGEWQGRIKRIGAVLDEATHTVPVYLSVDSGPRGSLVEGSFVAAQLPGRELAAAVRLPQQAVYGDGEVFLIESGRLARRDVTVARRENQTVLISSGLAAGDSVVVELLQGVADGMTAQPKGARPKGDSVGGRG